MLLTLSRKKQITGNPVTNTALALHIHISISEGKVVFQAKQCTTPNKLAQMNCPARASGRSSGPSPKDADQNGGTEVEEMVSKFR
jgi:hypothetical protein